MEVLINTDKKHAKIVISSVVLASIGSIFTIFVRPQLVMASDLQSVNAAVQEVNVKVDDLSAVVKMLAVAQSESRIDYLQDRIRELTAKSRTAPLTADEAYRLSEYEDRLEHARLARPKL